MKAIKKLWNYQILLISSTLKWLDQPGYLGNNTGCLTFILFWAWAMMLSIPFGSFMLNTLYLVFAMVGLYKAATSKGNLYALAPVSRGYALANLYLLPIFLSAFYFGILLAFSGVITLIDWGVSLFFGVGMPPESMLLIPWKITSLAGYKGVLFYIFLALIIILPMIGISVTPRRKARLTSLAGFIAATSALAFWLKNVLPPRYENNASGLFLQGFETSPSADAILKYMAAALLVIAPVSIRYAIKNYMADVARKND
jgi:hypothetical protein